MNLKQLLNKQPTYGNNPQNNNPQNMNIILNNTNNYNFNFNNSPVKNKFRKK